MYKLFMAFRYLRAHKIIYFSIVGVAVGIMTMVVVTSLMGGFSRDMRSRIRGMQTHIIVRSAQKDLWITDYLSIDRNKGGRKRPSFWYSHKRFSPDAEPASLQPGTGNPLLPVPARVRHGRGDGIKTVQPHGS